MKYFYQLTVRGPGLQPLRCCECRRINIGEGEKYFIRDQYTDQEGLWWGKWYVCMNCAPPCLNFEPLEEERR